MVKSFREDEEIIKLRMRSVERCLNSVHRWMRALSALLLTSAGGCLPATRIVRRRVPLRSKHWPKRKERASVGPVLKPWIVSYWREIRIHNLEPNRPFQLGSFMVQLRKPLEIPGTICITYYSWEYKLSMKQLSVSQNSTDKVTANETSQNITNPNTPD